MAIIVERKSYYKIGEISKYLELETHVIRYWESIFNNEIRPETTGTNRKLYTRSDLEMFAVIRYLVRDAQFSMDGARTRLAELRQTGELADLKLALIEYEDKKGIGSLAALSQLVSSRKKTEKASRSTPIPEKCMDETNDKSNKLQMVSETSKETVLPPQSGGLSSCDAFHSPLDEELTKLQTELDGTRQALNLKNTAFEAIQAELKTCQDQLQNLQNEYLQAQTAIKQAHSDASMHHEELTKLQASLAGFQQAIEERDTKIQSLYRSLDAAQTEVKNLKASLELCEKNYADTLALKSEQAETIATLKKELETMRSDLNGVCDELEITQRLAAQLQREFNAQTIEVNQTLEMMASHNIEIASKDAEIAQNVAVIEAKDAEIAKLQAELAQYMADLDQSRATLAEREAQIDRQDTTILLLQRNLETSKIHTQKMHETCASLKANLAQTKADLAQTYEAKANLEAAHQALSERLLDTDSELEQCRHALSISQTDLEQCQGMLDKCQSELLDTHETLSMRVTELELSRQELSECKASLASQAAEISAKDEEIQAQKQEIFEFHAQKYPERCVSLQEQLLAMTRHAQTFEQRIDGMEKERRSLRLALLNEIEYLRSA